MNKMFEYMYYSSPVIIQNLALSIYGYRLHQTRYGKDSGKMLEDLNRTQWFSKNELLDLQENNLKSLVRYSYENVPYYSHLLKEKKISSNDIKNIDDLRKLPILEKNDIRKNGLKLVSNITRRKIAKLYTSGTTGSPLSIYYDNDSRKKHYSFLSRFRAWFGIKVGMTRATFCGRIVVPPKETKPPFWRYDINENNYLFSSYHLSENNLKYYYEKLRRIGVEEIFAYPSSIYILAKYIRKNGLEKITPRFIMTTAETLLEYQRKMIEDSFQCKVSDQYGCTEMALFVTQCENGRYHINPEYGIVEVVDEFGDPVHLGKEGEVLCTGFVNTTMPLIRYRLGDTVTLSENQDCECGRKFPVIDNILGRMDDILVTPDGRPLGRLDPIFKGTHGIYETQIIQKDIDVLEFKVVKDNNFRQEYINELIYEIRKRTGEAMKIDITYVDEIIKDKNGKFRSVVSMLNPRNN